MVLMCKTARWIICRSCLMISTLEVFWSWRSSRFEGRIMYSQWWQKEWAWGTFPVKGLAPTYPQSQEKMAKICHFWPIFEFCPLSYPPKKISGATAAYTRASRSPHKKNSKRVKSRDLGDHSTSSISISWNKFYITRHCSLSDVRSSMRYDLIKLLSKDTGGAFKKCQVKISFICWNIKI